MGALSNPIYFAIRISKQFLFSFQLNWRAFQLSKNENTSCFEILMSKEMGLDRAPIEFQTFYIFHVLVVPPSGD